MNDGPAPEPAQKKSNPTGFWIGGGLLLVIAVLPPDISWLFAIIDVLLLWVVFSIPMARAFTGNCIGGGEKILFGLMAVVLAGVGAILLVGFACAVPMSRFNPH